MPEPLVILVHPLGGFFRTKNQKKSFPPLGLGYLAGALEAAGIRVEILDLDIDMEMEPRYEAILREKNPAIVGLQFTTATRFLGFEMIQRTRSALPDCLVVAGGPHVTLTADDTLAHVPELDVIVRGEGEQSFTELCQKALAHEDWCDIPSLSFRDDERKVRHTQRLGYTALDDLPIPARHLMSIEKYIAPADIGFGQGIKKMATIMTSRGCPFACSFCSVTQSWGTRFRARSADGVLDEIGHLISDYGVNALHILDDTFTVNSKRVVQICEGIIRNGWDIAWIADIRVDTVDKELIELMKRAGAYSLIFGVESGVQERLDASVDKRITLEQVRQVDAWIHEAGVIGQGLYIIGLPDETYEEARITLDFANSLQSESSLSVLKIYPGTEVEQIARTRGVIPADFSWAEPMPAGLTLPGVSESVPLYLEGLNHQQAGELMFRFARDNNLSILEAIPRALTNIRNVKDVVNLSRSFVGLIRSRLLS